MKKFKIYNKKVNSKGFTLIELMISTVVFSSILLIATIAIIYVSKTYVEGQVVIKNQDNSQAILMNLANAIKFDDNSNNNIVLPQLNSSTNNYYFCIGSYEYIYSLNQLFTSNNQVAGLLQLTNSLSPNCVYPTSINIGSSRQLLSQNERVGQLAISQNNNIYDISLTIGYGNNSVLQTLNTASDPAPPYKYRCVISAFSVSLCAVSSLSTTVTSRIGNI